MKALHTKVIICLTLFTLVCGYTTKAQERPYREPDGKNYWYVEIGGAAFLYSINYEKLLFRNSNIGLTGRVGLSYGFTDRTFLNKIKNVPNQVLAPFTSSVLIGGKERKEKLEVGGGFTLIATSPTSREIVPTAILGFRVVEVNGVCLRVSYTPFIRNREFINWFGVSLGQNF